MTRNEFRQDQNLRISMGAALLAASIICLGTGWFVLPKLDGLPGFSLENLYRQFFAFRVVFPSSLLGSIPWLACAGYGAYEMHDAWEQKRYLI